MPEVKVEPLVDAIVKRGVVVTGTRTFQEESGLLLEDKTIEVGPGGKVRLTAKEVASLREAGFLVDPEGPDIKTGMGPSFDLVDGQPAPTVTAAA